MSGERRVLKSTDGSTFFASAKAAALSRSADRLVRNCTKIGTDAWYMEMVIGIVLGLRNANAPGENNQLWRSLKSMPPRRRRSGRCARGRRRIAQRGL